jgi:hypothetical protein
MLHEILENKPAVDHSTGKTFLEKLNLSTRHPQLTGSTAAVSGFRMKPFIAKLESF